MADHRMFSKIIIDSDAFLTMPMSAQCLYFHLAMRADDDGFVGNPRSIQRLIGASDDDAKLLIIKRFIIDFDSGVVVIKHWRIHNIIKNDRYHETAYLDEKATLDVDDKKEYVQKDMDPIWIQDGSNPVPTWNQNGTKMEPEDKLGKDKISKVNLNNAYTSSDEAPPLVSAPKEERIDYQSIVNKFNEICTSLPKVKEISDPRKKALKRMKHDGINFDEYFQKIQDSDFLCQRSGGSWQANFDWIIQPKNIVKVQEGNYDNKDKPKQSQPNQQNPQPVNQPQKKPVCGYGDMHSFDSEDIEDVIIAQHKNRGIMLTRDDVNF